MEWLIGFAGLWLFFQWVLPIAILLIAGYAAYRWAQRRNAEFASSEPERRADWDDRLDRQDPMDDRPDRF